jgi:hypothetical protein
MNCPIIVRTFLHPVNKNEGSLVVLIGYYLMETPRKVYDCWLKYFGVAGLSQDKLK